MQNIFHGSFRHKLLIWQDFANPDDDPTPPTHRPKSQTQPQTFSVYGPNVKGSFSLSDFDNEEAVKHSEKFTDLP